LTFIKPNKNKAKIREILPRQISAKYVKHYELQGNKSTWFHVNWRFFWINWIKIPSTC